MSTTTKKAPTAVVIGPGSILSETSFYVVQSIDSNGKTVVKDDNGHIINLSKRYVDEITSCADCYDTEEKKTMTELAEIFVNSPRVAMTVAYITKGTEKTKKDFESEKNAKIREIQSASLSNATSLLEDLIENPITKSIPGKLRIMKGRHYGHDGDMGRVQFTDMELTKDLSKDYDTRLRLVDTRTIQWLIVNKVKYILK